MKYFIAADPGKRGAIVVIDQNNNILTAQTPLIGGEIDTHQIVKFLRSFEGEKHAVIENVHNMFGVGSSANFQFGRALGLLEGIISALDIPFTKVSPKEWQKEMWQGIKPLEVITTKKNKDGSPKYKVDTKATSLLCANRLYPNVNLLPTERSKKPSDGIVDALLMAGYCKRKFQ
jgi:hypothetical protein